MNGDFSRSTFRAKKDYGAVRKQQGRVEVDADFNELADIDARRDQITRIDVIGRCGFPRAAAGFAVGVTPDGADLTLTPGRGYVDGLLCECTSNLTDVEHVDEDHAVLENVILDGRQLVERDWVELSGPNVRRHSVRVLDVNVHDRSIRFVPELNAREVADLKGPKGVRARRIPTYLTQPYFPGAAPESLNGRRGTYLVYLDVWQRHVKAMEDVSLLEIVLGGQGHWVPAQHIWQVKVELLAEGDDAPTCGTLRPWRELIPASTGSLRARTNRGSIATDPSAGESPNGYRGFENRLYRVEVHDGGEGGDATFKWTRENDSVAVPWVEVVGDRITVSAPDDGIVTLQAGQWVELTDDSHDLSAQPGTLVKVTKVDAKTLIVDRATATGELDISSFPLDPKVRRWDGVVGRRPATTDEFIELEEGIECAFGRGRYSSGDYWLIPARTATADVEWPRDSAHNPLAQSKDGVTHHHCALALVRFGKTRWEVVEDCRPLFVPLTTTANRGDESP